MGRASKIRPLSEMLHYKGFLDCENLIYFLFFGQEDM